MKYNRNNNVIMKIIMKMKINENNEKWNGNNNERKI